jgi:glutamine amidotransferase
LIKIAIWDYGAGNIFSIQNSLKQEKVNIKIIKLQSLKIDFDGLILPGVGNFESVLNILDEFRNEVKNMVQLKIPILGICLGMQLLYEYSEEAESQGLGLLKGKICRLPSIVKTPHMGWNNIKILKKSKILYGIENESWMYFAHSYYPNSKEKNFVKAITKYGITIPVVIEKDMLFGTQFHPEKSGINGLKIIKNFINICKR